MLPEIVQYRYSFCLFFVSDFLFSL